MAADPADQDLTINADVGIGIANPEGDLHIYTAGEVGVFLESAAASQGESDFVFRKSRSGGVITAGDRIGRIAFNAHDGTSFNCGARIDVVSEGTISTGQTPVSIRFSTEDTAGAFGERMRITPLGDVGIGTSTPINQADYQTLTIAGGFGGNLRLDNAAGTTSAEFRHQGGSGTFLGTLTSQDLFFETNSTTRMTIENSGNVGIGTTTPDYRLNVEEAETTYLTGIYNTSTNAAAAGLYVRIDGDGNLLTLNSGGTDIATVSEAQTTFNNPVSMASAGDVSVAYDLLMANTTAGNIKFQGPGYVETDSAWQNLDLTLRAAGTGVVVIDDNAYISGNVGIGTTSPGAKLEIKDDEASKLILREEGTWKVGDINSIDFIHYSGTTHANAKIQSYVPGGSDIDLRFYVAQDSGSDRLALELKGQGQNALFHGNVGIGATSFGTNAATVLGIKVGTAPASSPADIIQLYAEGADAELKVRDELGNITVLSPHNFSMFEPSLDIEFPWAYYSKNPYLGIEMSINMIKAIKTIEELSGEKLIYLEDLADFEKESWDENQENVKIEQDKKRNEIIEKNEQKQEKYIENMAKFQAGKLEKEPILTLEEAPEEYMKKEPPKWLKDRMENQEELTVEQDEDGKLVEVVLKTRLAKLGLVIDEDGSLEVRELKTKAITLYDRQTDAPYCVFVENGDLKTTSGECDLMQDIIAGAGTATVAPECALVDYYSDNDGDGYGDANNSTSVCEQPTGYVLDNTDCDDADANINPGITEICADGVDNDCDGIIDNPTLCDVGEEPPAEELPAEEPPAEEETPADPVCDADNLSLCDTQDACETASLYWYNEICNVDSEPEPEPEPDPTCDADNLDLCIQDDCSSASGYWYSDTCNAECQQQTYYLDADSDTYGDPNNSTSVCEQPTGYVLDNTDCDDTNANTNPTGTETCDGADNNCNGAIDENCDCGTTSCADGTTGDDCQNTCVDGACQTCAPTCETIITDQ